MAKDRMDRKELRAPDEFIVATTGVVTWAQKNGRTVLAGVAVAVAVFFAVGIYLSSQAAQRRDANADLAAAMATYREGDFEAAAGSFDGVAERWRGTTVGPLAAILSANSQLRAGDTKAAIETLSGIDEKLLPAHLRQQRDMIWASALEASADWQQAAAKYAVAAGVQGPYSAEALVGEARTRARAGEGERANELYRRALNDFPTQINRSFIEAQLG